MTAPEPPPQYPAPDQQQWQRYPAPDQRWQQPPAWHPAGPPPPHRRRVWPWVAGGAVLLALALLVTAATTGLLGRDPVDPTADPTPTTTVTESATDDQPTDPSAIESWPVDQPILLTSEAPFSPDTVGMTFEPPVPGATHVPGDDPNYPRWDWTPECYVGLSTYEYGPENGFAVDSAATLADQESIIEYFQQERLDVEVLQDNGTMLLDVATGHQVQFHVVEMTFRRTADDPLLWTAFVTRDMPQVGWGLSINYTCPVGEEPATLDVMLDGVTVSP